MPSLTRPCLALLVPALSCHGLSVPKLAFPYPVWLCTVQHCSSCRPCPVLLTMLDPVRSCPALLNTDRPFVALPGPSRPRLVLLCFTLPGAVLPDTARPWSALHEPAQFRPTLPIILPWSTQPGSILSCLALDCLTLPFLPLSGAAAHARSCPALRDTLETWLLAPPWTFGRLVKGDDI